MQVDDDILAGLYRNPSMELEEIFPVEQFFGAYMSQLEAAGPTLSRQPQTCAGMGSMRAKMDPAASSDSSSNLPGKMAGVRGPSTGGIMSYEGFNASPGTQGVLDDTLQQRSPFSQVSPVGAGMMLEQHALDGQNNFGGEATGPFSTGMEYPTGYGTSVARMDGASGGGMGFGSEGHLPPGGFTAVDASASGQSYTGVNPNTSPQPGQSTGGFMNTQLETGHLGSSIVGEEQGPQSGPATGLLTAEDLHDLKGRRARHRTPRQQMLNKQAQQRYRERKKAKALELEQAVEALSNRVEELKTVKKEKHALEEKTLQLERALLEKEAELQRLKSQTAKKSTELDSNCSDVSTAEFDMEKEMSEQAKLYHSRVANLRDFMTANRIDVESLRSPNTADLVENLVKEVGEKVEGVCNSCMKATRQEGPNIWELITASIDGANLKPHNHDRWLEIARSMSLAEEQTMRALILRDEHTKKLEAIYAERQQLNLEAISMLLPSDHGGRAPAAETKVGCLGLTNFLHKSSHRSKTAHTLDKLKSNLRDEQKAVAELEYMVFHRVLNPIQAAWFTLACYPHHCDCFSLLNATYELSGALKSGLGSLTGEPLSPGSSEAASKNK